MFVARNQFRNCGPAVEALKSLFGSRNGQICGSGSSLTCFCINSGGDPCDVQEMPSTPVENLYSLHPTRPGMSKIPRPRSNRFLA